MKSEIRKLENHISKANNVLIISHMFPDIDSIGSSLAVYAHLKTNNISCQVWVADKIKEDLHFLPGSNEISANISKDFQFDTVIVLDSSSLDRVKNIAKLNISETTTIINIDHHLDNKNFSTINIVDIKASSVGEILSGVFDTLAWDITPNIATCLYAAIVSDTGRFLFNNTTSKALATASGLVCKGANPRFISQCIYENLPPQTFELIKIVLDRLVIKSEYQYAYTSIPKWVPESPINIIDFIRQIRDIEVFLVFTELKSTEVKISLRSKHDLVDVSKFAALFGGGGHKSASGIKFKGSLAQAEKVIIQRLEETLLHLNKPQPEQVSAPFPSSR
jgi:bifunctional oligoribonuclease and PAP phosphatase NrnA